MSWLSSLAQRAAVMGYGGLKAGAKKGAKLGISAGGASITNLAQQELIYQANWEVPGLVIGPDEVLELLYSESISDNQADDLLRYHGIRWSWADGASNNKRAWNKWIENNRPSLEGQDLIDAWLRGNVPEQHVREVLRRAGLVQANVQAFFLDQRPPADLDTLRQQWRLGGVSWNTFRNELRRQGWLKDGRYRYDIDATNPLDVTSLFQLFNRGAMTGERMVRHLAALGFVHDGDRDALLKLRNAIPGPQDLVQFAVREVWDPAVVRDFGYDEEFPEEFRYWMQKQGLDWAEDVPLPGGGTVAGVSWPRAYWRAHWQPLSPSQAYEALHRLRGDPNRPETWRVPGVRPFTSADLARILKIADYPPRVREVLEAVSYNVPSRVDLRRMFQVGVITRPDMVEGYQDLGFTLSVAQRMARFTELQVAQADLAANARQIRRRVGRAYKLGTMQYNDALRRLYGGFVTNPDQVAAYNALTPAEQLAAADRVPGLRAFLDGIDADRSADLVQESVKAIRAAYLRFDLVDVQAEQQLLLVGVQQGRTADYLAQWRAQRQLKGHHATASELGRWVKEGSLSEAAAMVRLQQLGYSTEDARRVALDYRHTQQLESARSQEKAAKTRQAQRKALVAQQKELARLKAANGKRLTALGTSAKLVTWLSKDWISEAEMRRRLADLGRLPADIDRLVREAYEKRGAQQKKATTDGKTTTAAGATANGVPAATPGGQLPAV